MSASVPATASLKSQPAPSSAAPPKLQRGTAAYMRTAWAMFYGGFATFLTLYCMQPLMPALSEEFGITPAHASMSVSAATGTLALALLPVSALADRWGRRGIMCGSLFFTALLTIASAFTHDFAHLVFVRALLGISIAGLPAVAMAYLAEEIDAGSLGLSMGLYIAGNAMGGMCGRLLAAGLTEWLPWRESVGLVGMLSLVLAVMFWRNLPVSRHFHPASASMRQILSAARAHLTDAGLPWLFVTAFLLMGCFVSMYNYVGYRLVAAPFELSPGALGLVFTLYVVGMFSSAWAGRLSDRIGRRNVLWIMVAIMAAGVVLTLSNHLAVLILGIALCTFGFFGAHSIASSWVGRRAQHTKALASALYLFAYYLGSSVLGSTIGLAWHAGGWHGVAVLLTAGLVLALAVALKLRRLPPLASDANRR
jgi:MFS transporter, YNFM family, putative membrane transport protein